MTQQSQPNGWVEKITQHFLECTYMEKYRLVIHKYWCIKTVILNHQQRSPDHFWHK